MILGAGLWAVITLLTAYEFSFVAMGIGALVALAMNSARPTNLGIAVVAALLTVIGCALGRFFKATREVYVPSGAVPSPAVPASATPASAMPGTAQPPYAPRQAYGQAPWPGAAAQPYPPRQGHGPGQPPYAPGREYPPR